MFLHACINPFTASIDLVKSDASAVFSSISIIFSTPLVPIMVGTPPYVPVKPYAPSTKAAQGTTRFWSFMNDSAIWIAEAAGA